MCIVIRWLGVALFVVTLGMLGAEALLRTLAPREFATPGRYPNHPGTYRWKNAHGELTLRINSHGFRGPEVLVGEPDELLRIAVIGDSTTWGEAVGDRETYPSFAQRRLIGEGFSPVEVLNISYPGAGLRDYVRFWKHAAQRFSPDIVVIGFFLGNDQFSVVDPYAASMVKESSTTARRLARRLRRELGVRVRAMRLIRSRAVSSVTGEAPDIFDVMLGPERARLRSNPLREQSIRANASSYGVEPDRALARLERIPAAIREAALAYELDPWLLSAAVVHPQSIRESHEMTAPHILRSWEGSLNVLEELISEIRGAGGLPVIFAIPRGVQVSPHSAEEFRLIGFDVPDEISTSRRPQDRLAEFADGLSVLMIDPLDALIAEEATVRLYFPYDVHLTSDGNRILGDVLGHGIAESLRAEGLARTPEGPHADEARREGAAH